MHVLLFFSLAAIRITLTNKYNKIEIRKIPYTEPVESSQINRSSPHIVLSDPVRNGATLIQINKYIYIYIHIPTCSYTLIYNIHTCHTYTDTYTHIHTHTHTQIVVVKEKNKSCLSCDIINRRVHFNLNKTDYAEW